MKFLAYLPSTGTYELECVGGKHWTGQNERITRPDEDASGVGRNTCLLFYCAATTAAPWH